MLLHFSEAAKVFYCNRCREHFWRVKILLFCTPEMVELPAQCQAIELICHKIPYCSPVIKFLLLFVLRMD